MLKKCRILNIGWFLLAVFMLDNLMALSQLSLITLFTCFLFGVASQNLVQYPHHFQPENIIVTKEEKFTPFLPTHIFKTSYVDLSITRNITTQVGQTVYLHCIVESLGERTVSWIRLKDFHLLTVGLYTYTSDTRFQSLHMQYSNDWALQIKFVQPGDQGLYECQLSGDPAISNYLNLRVAVPEASIVGGPDIYVEDGGAINLTCLITKSPEPPVFVFWYHNDRMINYDTTRGDITFQKSSGDTAVSRLIIQEVQPSDSGNYTCCPSNSFATSVFVHVLKGLKQAVVQNDAGSLPISRAGSTSRVKHIAFHLLPVLIYNVIWR